MLRHLPAVRDPNLLVGRHPADDAAVYRLTDELALVQTVDFFTPVVDDPYTFGQIAAANALSDVYAMGGTPITALNILSFPADLSGGDVPGDILRGGADMAASAGVAVIGGHSVDDIEPKYGMAVTGTVHPDRFVSAHGARTGNRLVLTKPLGTGVIATALKNQSVQDEYVWQSVRWMTTLNKSASESMLAAGAFAATDVTGFGLLGHLVELCEASGVSAELNASDVPLLPGALQCARDGFNSAGSQSNWESVQGDVYIDRNVSEDMRKILVDPQTSGGLLICLDNRGLEQFRQVASADALTAEVGRIIPAGEKSVVVRV